MSAPRFELAEPFRAGRVTIPAATLTFTGCDRERSCAPRATFSVSRDTPATVNGTEIYGTVHLEHGRHFVKWLDRSGDKAEHRIGWGARDSYIQRVPGPDQFMAPDATDAQRKALREFAEAWADRVGVVDVIRAAEVARLLEESHREAGKADELREQAEALDKSAAAIADEAVTLADATKPPGLFAVVMNTKTESTHGTKVAALRAAVASAKRRGKFKTYGTHSHDFPGVLDVFAGEWIPVPEHAAMEAREDAERNA